MALAASSGTPAGGASLHLRYDAFGYDAQDSVQDGEDDHVSAVDGVVGGGDVTAFGTTAFLACGGVLAAETVWVLFWRLRETPIPISCTHSRVSSERIGDETAKFALAQNLDRVKVVVTAD